MSNRTLNKYIKQNLASGFPEIEIRRALVNAGWPDAEIAEGFRQAGSSYAVHSLTNKPQSGNGFFARQKRTLLTILLILIISALLVYASSWAYQQLSRQNPEQTDTAASPMETVANLEEAKHRDQTRLRDIQNLQAALENYFDANQAYPKMLSELESIPLDPKSKQGYIYSAFDDPPLYYSLSFVLETEMGSLKNGLNVVSSELPLQAAKIAKQEGIVSGQVSQIISDGLQITDLSVAPFKPQEEVAVTVDPPASAEIESAFLIMKTLKLVDRARPFGFHFSAPREPGAHAVEVFAFDKSGNVFFQETILTVVP